jgi:uncharacterized delta-60 repeat protein
VSVVELLFDLIVNEGHAWHTLDMKNKIRSGISILVLIVGGLLPSLALAAPGNLDPTFGKGGRVFTSHFLVTQFGTAAYPQISSVLVQPDGMILVAGNYWEDGMSEFFGPFVLRYFSDGTLDPSFGINGIASITGYLLAMARQPDGKIVCTGSIFGKMIVQRFTASGETDTTFGNSGTTTVPGFGAFGEGYSIILQPDGKLLGMGSESGWNPDQFSIVVFRLNSDGNFDRSFGSGGTGVLRIVHALAQATSLLQGDGRIVVSANLETSPGTIDAFLARYTPDGLTDMSFGTGGVVRLRINDQLTRITCTVAAPGGKIIAAGYTYDGIGSYSNFIAQFSVDGSPDTSFGRNGVLNFDSTYIFPAKLAFDHDGTLYVMGNVFTTDPSQGGFGFVRLRPDFSLDPGFGIGGRSVVPMNVGGNNYAYAGNQAFQPDGNIVAAGSFENYYSDSHEYIALTRIDGGPSTAPAEVSVSGRVMKPNGRGISRAQLTFVDDVGNTRYAQANKTGYYRSPLLHASLNYRISVSAMLFTFAQPTQAIFVTGNLTGINFVSNTSSGCAPGAEKVCH